uniref:Uncharacterized protein n=1 Tax=Arundo donax TaxID=35708 RepID=A0A0A9AF45_ARUDO
MTVLLLQHLYCLCILLINIEYRLHLKVITS